MLDGDGKKFIVKRLADELDKTIRRLELVDFRHPRPFFGGKPLMTLLDHLVKREDAISSRQEALDFIREEWWGIAPPSPSNKTPDPPPSGTETLSALDRFNKIVQDWGSAPSSEGAARLALPAAPFVSMEMLQNSRMQIADKAPEKMADDPNRIWDYVERTSPERSLAIF